MGKAASFYRAILVATALAAGAGHCLAGAEPALDARGLTGSIAFSAQSDCVPGPPPPVRIATHSKYDQAFASRSIVSQQAAAARKAVLAPIESQLRRLAAMARMHPACAARMVTGWAESGAMTEMGTSDANLSRDRLMVDIATSIDSLRSIKLAREPVVATWLARIARQTMHYYDWQAGPTSRRNNHRYWAGLSVGLIGNLLQDEHMIGWSSDSFAAGACQIDAEGFLPLELARGAKALDYHFYAYRALASMHRLALSAGYASRLDCADRLERMRGLMVKAMAGDPVFVERTGLEQDALPHEPSRQLSSGL